MFKAILIIISTTFFLISCGNSGNKGDVVFIDNAKIFEGFSMKKDYDVLLEKDLKNEVVKLDSLEILMNNFQGIDTMDLFKLKKDYYVTEQLYSQKFQELSQKYTHEVNQRLNEYIKEYCQEKEYSIMLGSGAQGNIMFVSEQKDMTDDLLKYINGKYAK